MLLKHLKRDPNLRGPSPFVRALTHTYSHALTHRHIHTHKHIFSHSHTCMRYRTATDIHSPRTSPTHITSQRTHSCMHTSPQNYVKHPFSDPICPNLVIHLPHASPYSPHSPQSSAHPHPSFTSSLIRLILAPHSPHPRPSFASSPSLIHLTSPIHVAQNLQDIAAMDPELHRSLDWMLAHSIEVGREGEGTQHRGGR